MLYRPAIAILASATQAFTMRYCVQRRREGGERNPVKSTGSMQCGVHGREYAHSISSLQAVDGIYALKPETQRPLQERRHRYRSPSPPMSVRGRPRNLGATAIQEIILRGPLEIHETRTSVNRQRPTRRIARAPCVQSVGRQWASRVERRAQTDPMAATPAAARTTR